MQRRWQKKKREKFHFLVLLLMLLSSSSRALSNVAFAVVVVVFSRVQLSDARYKQCKIDIFCLHCRWGIIRVVPGRQYYSKQGRFRKKENVISFWVVYLTESPPRRKRKPWLTHERRKKEGSNNIVKIIIPWPIHSSFVISVVSGIFGRHFTLMTDVLETALLRW